MIKVFDKFETNFNNNGLQILDDSIIDAEIYEVLNGIYSLTFKYPIFCTKYLEEENIITSPTPKNGVQPFRISKVNKEMGYYNVTAYHIFYDLADNLIEDIYIVENGGSNAIEKISEGSQYHHPFKMFSDIDTVNNCRIVRYNVVQALLDSSQDNTFISRWGGEIERNNYNITMHKNLGTDRGIQVRYKKNLIGYEADIDYTQIATRIMPKGFDGLLLPEKYVDSENIDYYPHPKIRIIEYGNIKAIKEDGENPTNDEDAVPMEEAYELLREAAKREYEVNHIDIPHANYKVDFVELSSTEEYKNIQVLEKVYLGDTVKVIHEEENLDISARVISYKYNPIAKKYTELELGNYQKNFTDITSKIKDLDNKIDDTGKSILEIAKEHATDLINTGFGGYVRIHPDRILIMDTEDEMTAQNVWQWNKNGLGFSSTGINGPYGLAMTYDGSIVADYITTGILNANIIRAGSLKGNNFELDLDSGRMVFGPGSITSDTLTDDLKEELKGEDGKDGAPGASGQDGQDGEPGSDGSDGSDATLPYWWHEWNGTTTTIGGNYTISPRMYVGNPTKGVFFGDNCVVDSKGNSLSGIVGYWSPDLTFHLKPDGSLTLGNKAGRQFIVDVYGDVTVPKIKAEEIQTGAITTDAIYPGGDRRIVFQEDTQEVGRNELVSIDASSSQYEHVIRLKANAVSYVKVNENSTDVFTSYGQTLHIGSDALRYKNKDLTSWLYGPYDSNRSYDYNGLCVQKASRINLKAFDASAASYLALEDSAIYSVINGTFRNHSSISDRQYKENIKYLDSEEIINKNEKTYKDSNLTLEDCYNFIRDELYLCTFNFNDKYYPKDLIENKEINIDDKINFIAQDIKDTKVGRFIVLDKKTNLMYQEDNYISIIAGALQAEIQKREELEQRISKLEEKLNL